MDIPKITSEQIAIFVAFMVGLDWIIKRVKLTWDSAKLFVTTVLDERFPQAIKSTLSNGGGEIIRKIIKEENELQSKLHRDETSRIVQEAIRAHEVIEQAKLQEAMSEFRAEITDRYRLKGRAK